ncbi:cytochrome P450 [Epithele typhae]|uniref:cytochrome P450 n=1 Tax=Epithele typhae TaxID=378194 RepID=UPI002008364A|nr:cytochrome P450 [Epithele typhae]KAH9915040.1 cytochrome P450 [Epithele typhae]
MLPLTVYVPLAVVLYAGLRLMLRVLRPPFANLPGPSAQSFFAGNLIQLFEPNAWGFHKHLIETYGPVARLSGLAGRPVLHVCDPKALQSILVKDSEKFLRSPESRATASVVVGPGLFQTSGDRHKRQRKMLMPVFSGAHMRDLTPMFIEVTDRLKLAIETRIRDGTMSFDVNSWLARTALELVGQGGLGTSLDPLTKDTSTPWTDAVKGLSTAGSKMRHLRGLLPYILPLGPAWLRGYLVDFVPLKALHDAKAHIYAVHGGCVDLLDSKRAALQRGDEETVRLMGEGKDVMSLLLKANMLASEEDRLPEDELLAQMGTFIIAGSDTTSNALSRTLQLLSDHPDVQDKLRVELRQAYEMFGTGISYDEINKLDYLDAVCRETLRLHPPVAFASRESVSDAVIPLSEPVRGKDGSSITEIPVPKGTSLFLNLAACNEAKALWGEDAEEWKPERWLKPLPRAVEEARIPGIYSNLMTFLAGSYSCIGFKFSQLEMKVVLYLLVSAFTFKRGETPIFWSFAGIAYPTTGKKGDKPQLWLDISLAPS